MNSTALKWQDDTKKVLKAGNYASGALLALFCYLDSGMVGGLVYFLPGLYLQHNLIQNVDINDRESCGNAFTQSKYFGILIFLSLILYRGNKRHLEKKQEK